MFEKRKGNDVRAATTSPSGESGFESTSTTASNTNMGITAMIGPTIKIKGNVTGDEDLIVCGTVDGLIELSGHDLTIGQSGHVNANLIAKTVKIEGQITGDITGSEKVIVSRSGRVQGNIVAPRVTLEDGAKFKGSIDMDPGVDKLAIDSAPKRAKSGSEAVEPKGAQTTA
ncbi:MAG: polymer-forming cytoskeletal protein [Gammaproteobacteria bacterium]|nr:polymer-forming cytoskeletal protein [Gammaproteobacteria bacterium]